VFLGKSVPLKTHKPRRTVLWREKFYRVLGAESYEMTLRITGPKVKNSPADLDDDLRKITNRAPARCPTGVTTRRERSSRGPARLLGRADAAYSLSTPDLSRFSSKYPALGEGGICYRRRRRWKATTPITMPSKPRIGHSTLVAGGSKGEADGGGCWRLGIEGAKPLGPENCRIRSFFHLTEKIRVAIYTSSLDVFSNICTDALRVPFYGASRGERLCK
jgi:hypothetical protein